MTATTHTRTSTHAGADAGADPDVDAATLRAAVIEELLTARTAEHTAQLHQLQMALQWAHLHPAPLDPDGTVTDYAGWGEPGLLATDQSASLVPLAGPGAPLVSPLAPLELGAALDRTHDHARTLLGDALELAHRLPRLWTLAQQGRVPVWLARRISRETHDLTHDAALRADRLITAAPDKITQVDTTRLIHEARLHTDPDRATADEEAAAARRGVWLRRDGRAPGATDVTMTLDTDDADLLDQTLNRIAADLRDLGDTTTRDIRRATAVGILADPQHALDLMTGRTTHPGTHPGPGPGGNVDLTVHLTPHDLTPDGGAGVEETRGAVSTHQLAAWIRRRATHHARLRVRTVLHNTDTTATTTSTSPDVTDLATGLVTDLVTDWLTRHDLDLPVVTLRTVDLGTDLGTGPAIDTHDPTPTIREHVITRDAHCVFPGCRRSSRTCDLDHIDPYRSGGPPGQTRPSNLAPLCRRHHNAKTHHHWTYQRAPDGTYHWSSPTGHHYDVRPHTRAPLTL